jgi:hypothetical protein
MSFEATIVGLLLAAVIYAMLVPAERSIAISDGELLRVAFRADGKPGVIRCVQYDDDGRDLHTTEQRDSVDGRTSMSLHDQEVDARTTNIEVFIETAGADDYFVWMQGSVNVYHDADMARKDGKFSLCRLRRVDESRWFLESRLPASLRIVARTHAEGLG